MLAMTRSFAAASRAARSSRAGGRTIVLRFDHQSWPDITGFLVQAERTGVRACVANPVWTFMMTSQFICTSAEISAGRVFWFATSAPRSEIIGRLRQAVVTAGPGHPS